VPDPWHRRTSDPVFTSPWVSVHRNRYALPTGVAIDDFYVVSEPPGVTIVAVTPGGEVILVEQYRAAVDCVALELPAGYISEGTSPLEQARRELREESGYLSDRWHEIATLSPSPHRMAKVETVFLALGAEPRDAIDLDATEDLNIKLLPMDEASPALLASPQACAVCVAALYIAREALRVMQE